MKPNLFSVPRLFLIYVLCFQMACSNSISGTFFSSVSPVSPANFGVNGIVTTNIDTERVPTFDRTKSLAVQTDGKFIVAGGTASSFALVRYNSDGSLDTGFNSTGKVATQIGTGAQAYAVAVQADGRILAAGEMSTSGASSDFALIRYNPNGSLDTTFGGTGKVTTTIGTGFAVVFSLAIQTDGKILAAGRSQDATSDNFTVVRYNPNGSLDTSFGGTGTVVTDIGIGSIDFASSLVIQTDGKALVTGYTNVAGNNDFAIIRYNSNGSLDTSFGGTGKVTTDFGVASNDYASSLEIQADGKILVAGTSSASGSEDFALVRYNVDGSLDSGFGGTGKITTDIGVASQEYSSALAIQTNGKIVVAGHTFDAANLNYALVRYNSDGSLDGSFGGTGKVTNDIGVSSDDYLRALAIQADGKLVAAGESNAAGSVDFTLVRYNTDGSLDVSLGGTGKVVTNYGAPSDDFSGALAIQADGKIVHAGTSDAAGDSNFALVRYNTDGSLDTSFNGTGKVTTDIGAGSYDIAYAMTIQSDGKIVVAGETDVGPNVDFTLVRYNIDGSLDTSFGTLGKVITSVGIGINSYVKALAIQADGKIVAAGLSSGAGPDNFTVVRYNTDGSLDTVFNGSGYVITDIGAASNDGARSLAIQSDGKIIVAGESNASGNYDFALVRYNTDGSLDTSFNGTGKVTTDHGTSSIDSAKAMAIQSNGKIVVSGYSDSSGSNDFALVRYNADGSLDTSFNGTGKVTTDIGAASNDVAVAIAVQSDGKIVVAGESEASGNYDIALVRYNADVGLDTSFNGTGKVITDIGTGSNDFASATAIQSDGKIFFAGTTNNSGDNDFALIRYKTDGSR